MKPSGILMIFPMLTMASQLPIWHWGEKIGDFVSNPLRQSRVPQFILDTRHPWILENKKKLERLPDAQSFLCSPPQELQLDPQQDNSKRVTAELEVPPDVFDYLEIGNSRYGTNNPSWSDALGRLQEMQGCPAALEHVKTFKAKLYVGDGREYIDGDENILELARPPDGPMTLFADVLGNMTNLETLKWGVWPSHTQFFENHFIERGLVMPSVTRLEPDVMNHFLVRMCPNIIDLEPGGDSLSWWHYGIRNRQDHPAALLVRAGAYASSLETFSIDAGWKGWDMSLIQGSPSAHLTFDFLTSFQS
ncbi:hypothetical protein HD806DRAFT_258416 [Xylariaceae sp. AK1471]|nr:hypothetical protein HD806DRAFT_258416 [Xylariaceae sp. AK1471]